MIDNANRTILTITGSDGMGISGVQADVKIASSLGVSFVSVITSITIQNSLGIQDFFDLPSNIVEAQIDALINDVQPQIVKIGMIRNVSVLRVISEMLSKYHFKYVVYDPVVYSSRGDELMSNDVISQVKQRLLPHCSIVVIKPTDAQYLLGKKQNVIYNEQSIIEGFKQCGCKEILLIDNLFHGKNNHISSAIAAYLSRDNSIETAINNAQQYALNHQTENMIAFANRSSALFNEFIEAIKQHLTTNNDVRFYADLLNVSGRYLAQVTKKIANKSPKNIIEDYVIENIEQCLNKTSKTIQEIAYNNGFSSQAHLTKFFKKKKGITPTLYRKNIIKQ